MCCGVQACGFAARFGDAQTGFWPTQSEIVRNEFLLVRIGSEQADQSWCLARISGLAARFESGLTVADINASSCFCFQRENKRIGFAIFDEIEGDFFVSRSIN